jgi:ABC-type protease/lipase transport system fused ATPase/permease subunit
MTGAFTTIISCFINASPNKKLIGYSYLEQMKDILPSFAAAIVMLVAVLAVQLLGFGALLTLVIQVLVGIVVYVAISAAAHLEPFRMVLDVLKGIKRKK